MTETKVGHWSKIKNLYRRAEPTAIYLVLIFAIISEIISQASPGLERLLETSTPALIFLVLLLIFRHVVENANMTDSLKRLSKSVDSTASYVSFNEGMDWIFANSRKVGKVDFLGVDGGYFCPSLLTRGEVKIAKLRALVKNPSSPFAHPRKNDAHRIFKDRFDSRLKDWRQLQGNQAKTLELKKYDADPSFFAVIIEDKEGAGKRGFFGLLEPIDNSNHLYSTKHCFLLEGKNQAEHELLSDLSSYFDALFQSSN